MKPAIHYLSLDDLLTLTDDLGAGPVREIGLLDSAAHRPQSDYFGEESYPSIELKAAALLHSLVKNDALVDGNKRLAWHAAVVFADLNGYEPDLSHDEAFDLVMSAAQSQVDVPEIAAALRLRPRA